MFSFKGLIVLATCLSLCRCKLDEYCSLCEDHTMCQFHGIGPDCKDAGGSGVTAEEMQEILDVHNWVRRLVASGNEARGAGNNNQPKAANMRKMVWDKELEKVAQRWADQCRFQHDTCREDPRWQVGQNIFWKFKYPNHHVNWTEAILSWYNEVNLFNPSGVEEFRFDPAVGHYSQMIWHDTYAIGCGRRDYGSNKLYVCNYGPGGNWIGEPIYTIGEPCSKCPAGTVCEEYLCAVPIKESPSQSKGVETKLIRSTPDEETSTVNDLKPPQKNGKDGQVSEGGKAKPCKCVEGDEVSKMNDVSLVKKEKNTRGTAPDLNDMELDPDFQKGIAEINSKIAYLFKRIIKKRGTCQ